MLKQTKKQCKTQQEPNDEQSKYSQMTIIFVSIFLNFAQCFSICLNCSQLCRPGAQFFSIFLDYVEICMEYIFVVLGAGSVFLNFSQFFSIFLDYVEICMEYIFVILGAGSVFLNFSQLSSWNYVISSVPKAAMARTGAAI